MVPADVQAQDSASVPLLRERGQNCTQESSLTPTKGKDDRQVLDCGCAGCQSPYLPGDGSRKCLLYCSSRQQQGLTHVPGDPCGGMGFLSFHADVVASRQNAPAESIQKLKTRD